MLTLSIIILVISSILYANNGLKKNENFETDNTINVFDDQEDSNDEHDQEDSEDDQNEQELEIESDQVIVTDNIDESKKINKQLHKRIKREKKKLKNLMQKNDAKKQSRKNQIYSIFKTAMISLIIVLAVFVGCKMVSNKT